MASQPIPNCKLAIPSVSSVQLTIPDGSLNSDHFTSTDGQEFDADKLQHIHKPGTAFGLDITDTLAAREDLVFVASSSATVRAFKATMVDTGTSTNVSFDLKKNGTSILSSAINFTHSDGDGLVKSGTLSSASLSAGDRLSIRLSVTSATGASGPFAWVEIEDTT